MRGALRVSLRSSPEMLLNFDEKRGKVVTSFEDDGDSL